MKRVNNNKTVYRQYIAMFDDGHDYHEVIYSSEHRNGSNANKADAVRQARLTGGRRAFNWQLMKTSRYDCY